MPGVKSGRRAGVAVWLLCLCLPLLCADTVELKNGNSIEGVVTEETDTHIVIDLGVGSMSVARSRVSAIRRADEAGREAIEREWEQKHFLHRKYVPFGLEDLAASFRILRDSRDAALRSRRDLHDIDDEIKALQKERTADEQKLVAVSRELQAADPKVDPEAYNALVVQSNALRAGLMVKGNRVQRAAKRAEDTSSSIANYLAALDEFRDAFEAQQRTTTDQGLSDREAFFLAGIADRLKGYDGELTITQAPVKREGDSTIVTVRINDRAQGQFILDTGAALVTLSAAFAQKLKIDLAEEPTIPLVLADGRRVTATRVVLDKVSLGDAVAHDVVAAVLPVSSHRDIDGLLGMSFLKHFVVGLDGKSGKLVLRQLKP